MGIFSAIGSIAGTVLGTTLGGPIGGAIGGSIGGKAGSGLDVSSGGGSSSGGGTSLSDFAKITFASKDIDPGPGILSRPKEEERRQVRQAAVSEVASPLELFSIVAPKEDNEKEKLLKRMKVQPPFATAFNTGESG